MATTDQMPYRKSANVYVIGMLKITGDKIRDEHHTIEAWADYGVTCYPMGALNGSIRGVGKELVAICTEQAKERVELEDPTYSVTVCLGQQNWLCTDEEAVIKKLRELYEKVVGA